MSEEAVKDLQVQASNVLQSNNRGSFTVPADGLYPHQWLWDSCFIAIGLRHLDVCRAQTELKSLVVGQWANGMLPHIIFDPVSTHRREHNLWRAWLNPHAPNGVVTSGLTQPPMLTEAVVRVGQKLKTPERRSWYKEMLPAIIHYHQWLYKNRDAGYGLVSIIHPYESGLDNSPPLIHEIRLYAWPRWLSILEVTKLAKIISLVRRDTRHLPPGQRMNHPEAIAYWALLRRLRKRAYSSRAILKKPMFAVEDLAFNCIFIRANKHLREMSKIAGVTLPQELLANMKKAASSLENLWDESSGQYFSHSLISGELIGEPTVATLLPLYAGCITPERAEKLVTLMKNRGQFGLKWPVPSVPVTSAYFDELKYWQGPTWININWLIIQGLKGYGFSEEASALQDRTVELVAKSGCHEYFSPRSGRAAGAKNFSWTAALTIDLLKP